MVLINAGKYTCISHCLFYAGVHSSPSLLMKMFLLLLTLWDLIVVVQSLSHIWLFASPMDGSTPGFPVLHHLPEFAQTHVHWGGDAIQPSHPLLPPSPSALNLPHHQGLFQWIGSSHQVAKVLELQHQSFQWIFRKFSFPLRLTALISLQSKGLSRVFSSTTVWKNQLFGAQPSLWSNSHIRTWYWKNHGFGCMDLCRQSDVFAFWCCLGLYHL